jgi:GTPase SAR1 family protein
MSRSFDRSHFIYKLMKKILTMGLPGAGKTSLALALKGPLTGVHFNADLVRGI